MSFAFHSKREPFSRQSIDLLFNYLDFKEVTGQEAKDLFKYAALSQINKTHNHSDKVR